MKRCSYLVTISEALLSVGRNREFIGRASGMR